MNKAAAIFAPIARLFRIGLDRFGTGGWAVFLVLVAAVIGWGWHLAFGENPWDRGVPEKLENEERLTIRDTIVCGVWAASAVNLVLALVLLALSRWWGGRRDPGSSPIPAVEPQPVIPVPRKIFWIGMLIAVAAAAWIRAPRLDDSFWNDEEQAFRKFTWGQHVITGEDGEERLEFRPTGWDRALFYSINGNNHVVHTVAAKAMHEIWRTASQPPEPEWFTEEVIRIEPYVSGLLTIVLIGAWLRGLGFPLAGAAASWMLALHPWHIRYSVEARGYSALMLFVLLAFLFLGVALRTNRWRWWLAYGAAQCLYLLCFAGAVYLAVAVNLIALGTLIVRKDGIGFRRWLVACVFGAMAFLQMMLAPALRFLEWVEDPDVPPFDMDLAFLRDFWTHLTLGTPWAGGDPDLHRFTSFRDETGRSLARAFGLKAAIPILAIAGLVLGFRKSLDLRRFFGALLLAAAVIWFHNTVSEVTFFVWYAFYLLLGFVVALAVVPETAVSGAKNLPFRVPVAAALVVLFVAGFAWLTHESRARVRAFDRHPMRQAVEYVRGEVPALGSEQAGRLTASVGSGANQMRTYDPWLTWLKKESDLDGVISRARESGKPLFVYCCSPRQVKRQMPGLFAKLEDRNQFDVEAPDSLKGLEEYWSYRIYRLRDPS